MPTSADQAPPVVWVLAGPTASGKTEVGLELAGRLGAEIVVADARQIYRDLPVGTAQPTPAERRRVRHHLVGWVDPLELYTAADYGRDAARILGDLAAREVVPLVVGGSGLYLRALIDGLFEGPGRDPELRAALRRLAETAGDAALHAELAQVDPESAARLHPHDRVRVIRALEVARLTGTPLSEHHRRQRRRSLAGRARIVVLSRQRDDLEARIAARTAAMFAGGLLDEARELVGRGLGPEHPVYRTVGYQQAFAVLRGELDVEQAIESTIVATRRYARRQLIWFRSLRQAAWVEARAAESSRELAGRVQEAGTRVGGRGEG